MSHHSLATTWWFYRSKRIKIEGIHHRALQENAIIISVIIRKDKINNVLCINFNNSMTLMLWIPRWTAKKLSSKLTRLWRRCRTPRIQKHLTRTTFQSAATYKTPIEMTKRSSPERDDRNCSANRKEMGHTFYKILTLMDSPCRASKKYWKRKEGAMQTYRYNKVDKLLLTPPTLVLGCQNTPMMQQCSLTRWLPSAKKMRTWSRRRHLRKRSIKENPMLR